MSFTNNKLAIYDVLGGSQCFDMHPHESLLCYETGSSVMMWDIVEDVRLRLHEHRNPVKMVQFFGEKHRFILSVDSGPSSTIFISEWASLNRVAELEMPRKKGKRYGTVGMQFGYSGETNMMYIIENMESGGFRLLLLSFKEFSLNVQYSNEFEESTHCIYSKFLLNWHKGAPLLSLVTVEKNVIKNWRILSENTGTNLEEQYCLAIHKDIQTAIHQDKYIILCMAEKLNVTLDEQLEYIAKVDMDIPPISHVSSWDKNLLYFTKNGEMYVYEHEKQKKVMAVNLREKVDFYTLEQYGSIESQLYDEEFEVERALSHGNMPIVAVITKKKELLVYDIQKDKVINYMQGHISKIIKIIPDSKSKTNFFSLCEKNKIIFWRYSVDKWIPKVYEFAKILKDDTVFNENKHSYSITDFTIYTTRDELYVSDSLGRILILEIKTGELVETHFMYKLPIFTISLSPNQSYLIVLYTTGALQILSSQTFSIELSLIQHTHDPNVYSKIPKILMVSPDLTELKTDYTYKLARHSGPNSKINSKKSNIDELKKKNFDRSFKIVSAIDFNTVKVFYMEKYVGSLNIKEEIRVNCREEIERVENHCSLNYLIIGCRGGRIRVFGYKERKFLSDWNLDMRLEYTALDPSGLYAINCGISPKKIKQTLSLNSSISILEIGTGFCYDAGLSIFGISYVHWFGGGKYVVLGTTEGRIYISEICEEIRETILDALDSMKKSVFWWDQWKLGPDEQDKYNPELIRKDIPEEMNSQQIFDKQLNSLIISQKERKLKQQSEGRYEYQNAHEGTHLMVHSNPFFKYPKEVSQKMPKRNKRKVNSKPEKEGNVLFLNKRKALDTRKIPQKFPNSLSRVKFELNSQRKKSQKNKLPRIQSQQIRPKRPKMAKFAISRSEKRANMMNSLNNLHRKNGRMMDFKGSGSLGRSGLEIQELQELQKQQQMMMLMEGDFSHDGYPQDYGWGGQTQKRTNFRAKREPGKLYSKKSRKRQRNNLSSYDSQAKLIYKHKSNPEYSSESSSRVRNIDGVIRFGSTKIAPKEGEEKLLSDLPHWSDIQTQLSSTKKNSTIYAYQEPINAREKKIMGLAEPSDIDQL